MIEKFRRGSKRANIKGAFDYCPKTRQTRENGLGWKARRRDKSIIGHRPSSLLIFAD